MDNIDDIELEELTRQGSKVKYLPEKKVKSGKEKKITITSDPEITNLQKHVISLLDTLVNKEEDKSELINILKLLTKSINMNKAKDVGKTLVINRDSNGLINTIDIKG